MDYDEQKKNLLLIRKSLDDVNSLDKRFVNQREDRRDLALDALDAIANLLGIDLED